jgi:hypothetical protein
MNQSSGKRNPLLSLLITIATFGVIYLVASGLFWLLQKIAIFLFIVTAILDYKVILDYFKWLGAMVQRSPISGILMGALTIVAYPVVVAFLFFKALLKRIFNNAVKNQQQFNPNQPQNAQNEDEYIEYEEIKEEPVERPKLKMRQDHSGKDFV